MKYKHQKLLFLLSQNCRSSYKHLSSELKQSIQTTAYQIQKLEKDNIIEYRTVIDYITLGYINVLIGFKVKNYSKEHRQKAYSLLKKGSHILQVLQENTNIDFIVETRSKN
ncbi:MAG: Lrp/AsnC family transcriptional regulator, partial [Candidatus Woesearchaeota archaeon]